jgi:hypothetical protein
VITPLSATDREKRAKLLALLGSNQAGERDAAGIAAHRLIQRSGLSWTQVLRPPPIEAKLQLGTWRQTCRELLVEHPHELRPWKVGFIRDRRRAA